jgi:hypothetical protein
MLAPIFHILPLTTVLRTRLLPTNGKVLVRAGQNVSPTDTIAEAVVGRKHTVVDIQHKLGLAPRKMAQAIKVKKGQKVAKGEALAATSGIFGKEIACPVDGKVVAVGSGKIVLETGGKILELPAGLPGLVTEVIPNRGVTIRAAGALVQGLWGNGKLDWGILMSLLDKPDDIFDPTRLDVEMRGLIILGGHVQSAKVLENAADLPARGLLVASLSPSLLSLAQQVNFPVVVLEGFGRRPLNQAAFKLLSTNIKREVSLNAEFISQQGRTRPELFIPLPVNQDPPELQEMEAFAPGLKVRVVYLTRPSVTGTITQVYPAPVLLPSGIRANAAEVKLENEQRILAPLTNLEVLG